MEHVRRSADEHDGNDRRTNGHFVNPEARDEEARPVKVPFDADERRSSRHVTRFARACLGVLMDGVSAEAPESHLKRSRDEPAGRAVRRWP
jgi:hypothetical protein